MKLYIILNKINNKIVAISEFKYHIIAFYLQNNYNRDIYTITKLTDKTKINNYLIMLDDYYLEEFDNFIIRPKDKDSIESIINYNKNKLFDTIEYLKYIKSDYNLTQSEIKSISKTISILKKNKKEDLEYFIDTESIIRAYYNMPSIRNNLLQLEKSFKYNINKTD